MLFLMLAPTAYQACDDIVGYVITALLVAIGVAGLALALFAQQADEKGSHG